MLKAKEPEEPINRSKIVYFTFLFLGVAILLPWNSLIMALDYFIIKLPGHNIDFVVSTLSNGPAFATNVLMIIFHKYFPAIKTIIITLFLMIMLNISLPLIPEFITK